MITTILRPLATGDSNALTLGAGANKVAAVDPLDPISHDDDTSYLVNTAGSQSQSFTLTNKPPAHGLVQAVRIGIRQKTSSGNAGGGLVARFGGVDGASAVTWGTDFSYTTDLVAVPRPGGGDWTMADIQDSTLQVKVNVGGSPTDIARITSLWLEVDWIESGGFVFF